MDKNIKKKLYLTPTLNYYILHKHTHTPTHRDIWGLKREKNGG